jgi:predicted SprT family Zn-dependent metalloprotease
MDLYAAQHLALDLMQQHGLLQSGWRFRWSSGTQRFGSAHVAKRRNPATGSIEVRRTIRLSRHMTRLNSEAEVRDTILHEIAHAHVGVEHGHDAAWRSMCVKIGAKPARLCGEDVKTPDPRYLLICSVCTRTLARRHRRMAPSLLRRTYCKHCGPRSTGKVQLAPFTPSPAPTSAQ